jgi:signal peptidase I
MSAAGSSVKQAVARFGSEHPLLVILALFIATSAAIHYWRERFFASGVRPSTSSWTRARFAAVLAIVLVSALALRAFVAEVYRVTSGSMLPDIGVGDRLLVWKSAYGLKIPGLSHRIGGTQPKRGDVIVFMGEEANTRRKVALVKRVIGIPGDMIVFTEGQALVNGWPVPSCDAGPYVAYSGSNKVDGRLSVEFLENRAYLTVRTFGGKHQFVQYNVRKDEVFVVGDDRGASADSRSWNGGQGGGVPLSDILGRATHVLVGGRPDGRLDSSRIFRHVGLDITQPGVDLTKTRRFVDECLKDPLPSVPPAKPLYAL